MHPTRALSLAFLLAHVPCFAQADPREKPEVLPLAKGQRLLFLGDSITHQGFWVCPLEVLLMTTRPELGLEFVNAGIGGDRVVHGAARFESEVLARKPDVVTVLFGMNDGNYQPEDARLLQTYEKDLDGLVGRITKETGARVVVFGPTLYDDAANDPKKRKPFYNGVLLRFQAAAERVAEAYKAVFCELNAPMQRVTDELRKADPKATLCPDAVHPKVAGGFAIADAIARALWKDPPSVDLMVTPAADGGNEHTLRIPRICFPIPPEAQAVAKVTRLAERLNRFTLRGIGAGRGQVQVLIDGKKIGVWSAADLMKGVDVGSAADAPWCTRAQELWSLAEQRRKLVAEEIRNKVAAIKGIKDEKQRAEAYAKIHGQLAPSWAKVRELEGRMASLCKPFDVRLRFESVP